MGVLIMPGQGVSPSPDLWAVFEYRDSSTGEKFGVSLATLLQCLCVAEQRHVVPPFEADWEAVTIPQALRDRAALSIR